MTGVVSLYRQLSAWYVLSVHYITEADFYHLNNWITSYKYEVWTQQIKYLALIFYCPFNHDSSKCKAHHDNGLGISLWDVALVNMISGYRHYSTWTA